MSTTGTDPSDALAEVVERPTGLVKLIDRLARRGGVSRRGLFVGAAVAGSALATDPKAYALLPQTAYATICGPGNTSTSGWTIFCATVNKGANACPPGQLHRGLVEGRRLVVVRRRLPLHRRLQRQVHQVLHRLLPTTSATASAGTARAPGAPPPPATSGSTAATLFATASATPRSSAAVACTAGSCRAWRRTSGTTARPRRSAATPPPSTARRTCRRGARWRSSTPRWAPSGPTSRPRPGRSAASATGAGATSPTRAAGSGRRARPPAVAMSTSSMPATTANGGASNLGYPTAALRRGLKDGGWIHVFEKGCLVDSASTTTTAVWGLRWTRWVAAGRENGVLGYPLAAVEQLPTARGSSASKVAASSTARARPPAWSPVPPGPPGSRWGAQGGVLGFPTERAAGRPGRHPAALPAGRHLGAHRARPHGRCVGRCAHRLGGRGRDHAAATGSRPRTSSTTATAR